MSKGKIFQTTSRIIRGQGSLGQVADEIIRLKKSRIMIITDPGIVQSGIIGKLESILAEAKITYTVYDQIEPDPRLQTAEAAADQLRKSDSDLVIGIGGGSPIDIAKIASVLATNNDDIRSYIGIDQIPARGLPTIIIPTTAGTGSEVTPIVILSDHDEKLKKGIVSSYLLPTVALLDPELTVGLPANITAATGMDALIHAIEAYTSKQADSITDVLACKAMELLYHNICKVFSDGSDIAAREQMLEGSLLAGMAFANAGVTAVHAFAYPIGAEFHIPHGVANSIMLTPVMEFNMIGNHHRFAAISKIFGNDIQGKSLEESAFLAVDSMRRLTLSLDIPKHLNEFGIDNRHIAGLAEGVMKVTRLLNNNPRILTQKDAEEIYKKVL